MLILCDKNVICVSVLDQNTVKYRILIWICDTVYWKQNIDTAQH